MEKDKSDEKHGQPSQVHQHAKKEDDQEQKSPRKASKGNVQTIEQILEEKRKVKVRGQVAARKMADQAEKAFKKGQPSRDDE